MRAALLLLLAVLSVTASAAADDLRLLEAGATYGDLVKRAQQVGGSPQRWSASDCLLRTTDAGVRLEGTYEPPYLEDLQLAQEFDDRLAKPLRMTLLTPDGRTGDESGDLLLATLTPVLDRVANAYSIPVLLLTQKGMYATFVTSDTDAKIQRTFGRSGNKVWPMREGEEAAVLGELRKFGQVFVAAEPSVPLERVRDVLRKVPGPIVFAAVLERLSSARDQALHARVFAPKPEVERPAHAACQRQAQRAPRGAQPGTVSTNLLMKAHDTLRETTLRDCAALLEKTRMGTLAFLVRVDRRGRAENICMTRDSIDSAPLRACALKVARRFQYPEPTGGAYTHLAFAPVRPSVSQEGLCDAPPPSAPAPVPDGGQSR